MVLYLFDCGNNCSRIYFNKNCMFVDFIDGVLRPGDNCTGYRRDAPKYELHVTKGRLILAQICQKTHWISANA